MGHEWKVGDWVEFPSGSRFLIWDIRGGYAHGINRDGPGSFSLEYGKVRHLPDCTGWDWEEPKKDVLTEDEVNKLIDRAYEHHRSSSSSVQKEIEPAAHEWKFGDWAECSLGIVRFIAWHGEMWFLCADGLIRPINEKDTVYLPNCTGFEWKRPEPIEPPPGYRLLGRDDIVDYGDILIARDANNCDLWKAVDGDKYGTTVGYFVDICHIAAFARKIEEQEPIEPPEGFRLMNADETIRNGDMFFQDGAWNNTGIAVGEIPVEIALKKYARYRFKAYARRIESDAFKIVEPKYRPFANAEEFMPHRDRWIVDNDGEMLRAISFDAKRSTIATRYGPVHFLDAFSRFKFEDGTPFGVLES